MKVVAFVLLQILSQSLVVTGETTLTTTVTLTAPTHELSVWCEKYFNFQYICKNHEKAKTECLWDVATGQCKNKVPWTALEEVCHFKGMLNTTQPNTVDMCKHESTWIELALKRTSTNLGACTFDPVDKIIKCERHLFCQVGVWQRVTSTVHVKEYRFECDKCPANSPLKAKCCAECRDIKAHPELHNMGTGEDQIHCGTTCKDVPNPVDGLRVPCTWDAQKVKLTCQAHEECNSGITEEDTHTYRAACKVTDCTGCAHDSHLKAACCATCLGTVCKMGFVDTSSTGQDIPHYCKGCDLELPSTTNPCATPGPPGVTGLTHPAEVGDEKLQVSHLNGFEVGREIIIGAGTPSVETNTVAGLGPIAEGAGRLLGAGSTLALGSPMKNGHPTGTQVTLVPTTPVPTTTTTQSIAPQILATTTQPAGSSTSSGGSMGNPWVIVGIVLAVVLVLAICGLLVCLATQGQKKPVKKKKKSEAPKEPVPVQEAPSVSEVEPLMVSDVSLPPLMPMAYPSAAAYTAIPQTTSYAAPYSTTSYAAPYSAMQSGVRQVTPGYAV